MAGILSASSPPPGSGEVATTSTSGSAIVVSGVAVCAKLCAIPDDQSTAPRPKILWTPAIRRMMFLLNPLFRACQTMPMIKIIKFERQ
jgi:hypothetical protein